MGIQSSYMEAPGIVEKVLVYWGVAGPGFRGYSL
jgi:hypothetical protein